MPFGTLLVSVRNLQDARFIQRFAEQLQSDRQLFPVQLRKSAWQTDSADAGEIARVRENVREVHLQRIGRALTEFERRGRRSG